MKRFNYVLLLLLAPLAYGQNSTSIADVAAGRAALVAHDLPTAHADFQAALTADPTNQTAAALLGIFGLFDVTSDPASQTFLSGLGVATSGRNPYQWTASIAKDGNGNPIVPANYNLSTVASFGQTTLLPASIAARANLAQVTDPNFLVTLTPAETKLPMPLNIDYGDVLMAQACLRGAEFLTHLGLGQNSTVNLQALYQVAQGNMLTLQSVLSSNPNFLSIGDTSERAAAQAALLDTIALYNQASAVIRARPAGVNRLFMIEPRQYAQEAQFRQILAQVQQSLTLTTPIDLNGKAVRLSPLFGATWSLRAQLPAFDASGFDVTAIPDASLGGLVSGFTKEQLAAAISNSHSTLAELGWQWVSPLPQGSTLYRYLVLPDGHRLVVGNGGAYLTSPDGTTWTANRIPGVGQFLDLATNAGRIVGVTYDGTIYSSTDDGATWQLVYKSGGKFYSVAYGGGRYVAVGDYGLTATSTDGVNWNQANQSNYGFTHVVYTGSQYVAVGYDYSSNDALIATSPDGQNWTSKNENNLSGANYTSVAQNGSGVLVAVSGSSATGNLAKSTDGGNTWTLETVAALNDVTFSNGSFVAVGYNGTNQTAVIGTSPDGTTWTPVTTPEVIALTGVSTGAGATFAVGQGGVILTSTDNVHFTRALAQTLASTLPQNKPYLALKAMGGQLYVGGGTGTAGGAVIVRSSDGQNFTATTVPGTANNITDFLLQGSTYYAVGNGGTILTSPDGANWTQIISGNTGSNTPSSLNAIAYLNGKFFAVGTGSKILSSPDGASNDWATTSLNIGGMQMNGIAYGNGVYVAVGGSNNPNSPLSYVVSSTDGSNWTQRFVPTSETLKGIVFYQGTFTAVGTGGAIIRSSDGVNWWGVGSGKIQTNLTSINVLNGEYYATQTNANLNSSIVISQSAVAMSSDGENWVSVPLGAANGPNRIEYFGNQLYVAAGNASILRSEPITALTAPVVQNLTPSPITANQGSSLALAVAPAAGSASAITTYQWSNGSGPISGATNPDLALNNIQSTDAGTYTVTVTNAGGPSTSTFTVNVNSTPTAPVITSNPQSATVSVGLNASLSVQATGTEPLSYQWLLNGTNLVDGGNVSGSQTSTLNLTGVQAANGGTYTVTVTGAGSTTSLPAVLTVDSNPVYNFSNLAGQANSSGLVNNTGTAARFNSPRGVALDPTGTILYIADSNNSVIRAVVLSTRVVSTFATGVSNVNALAVDASGNIYATCSDQTVRKITSGGVVSVFAGTSGSSGSTNASGASARFSNPQGIAIDPAGANLYIADTGNACIRKVVISSASVTTFAGAAGGFGFANGTGASARFNNPQGIAIDPAGTNLYVADTNNACIRKIVISSAAVSTYAGVPNNFGSADGPSLYARFSNPYGVTIGAVGNVFVADYGAQTIRRISPAGFVTTIGGQAYWNGYNDGLGSSALFSGPAGITLDSAGNLYVAEANNQTIRKGTPLSSPAAPVVAQSPTDQTVNVGSNVFFNAIASGTTTLAYQWLKNGVALVNGGNVGGATTASLSLTNVQTGDAGSYSVLVTGGGSALSAPANLTVTIPPTIGTQPVAQSVTSGGSVTLSVAATDVGYLTYQWLHNGLAVAGATGSTFTIPAAQRSDAGNYSVLINGVNGAITSNAALVQVAPTSFPGNLAYDPTFNASPLLTLSSRIFTAIPLAGGKWMVGGEFVQWNSTPRTFLARLNSDYSLDLTFTPPLINGFVYALAQAPDGSIYVGGEFTAVNGHVVPGLFKLNPSAALDLTWQAQDAPPNASVTALAVQSNGQPLVARASTTSYQTATTGTNVLRRLNLDGTLDGTFSVNIVTGGSRLNAVAVEAGGSITFAGTFSSVNASSRNGIARVNSTGATLDTVFGGAAGTNGTVFSMTLLANGNYLIGGAFTSVAGTSRNHAAIIDANGALDVFAPVGGFNGNVLGAAQLSDTTIVLAGTFSNLNGTSTDGLVRLTSTGAVSAYYSDGATSSSFNTVASARSMYLFPQSDGSVALFGSFQAALNQQRIGLAVITSGGTLASLPAPLLYRAAYANSAFVLPNSQTAVFGGIDLAGTTGPLHQAVRLNDNGSLDPTFPAGSGFNENGLSVFGIYRTVLQGDGKFLSIGDLSGYNGQNAYRLVRINADGSFDSSFNSGGGPSAVLTPILPLSGGRTLVYNIGTTNTFNGQPVGALVRLNADGSIDPSFILGSGINAGSVSTAYEQPDGKLVLAGSFSSYQGTTVNGLMRLNTDGSLDGTFSAGTGVSPTGSISVITGLPNGELVLAGNLTTYNGTGVNRMLVVSSTGAIDGSFTAPAGLNAGVGQVIVEEDGKFIVVGDFTGTPNPYAVRLTATGGIDTSFSLLGMTEGFGSGTRVAIGDDGSVYAYSGNPVSYNYGVPVAFARFRGAAVAPTVVTPPAAAAASLGGSATFSVQAGGTAPYTYQWRHNGANITGATYSVLNLTNLAATDAGNYDVIVTNAVTSVTSSAATLSIAGTAAPSIVMQSANATAIAGQNVSFSAGVSANPAATYQWQESTDNGNTWTTLSDGNGFSGTGTATLVVGGVSSAQSGAQFKAVITNAAGSATSTPVTLTVTPLPTGDAIGYNFTTLAGLPPGSADGTGAAAQFNNDNGVAVDSNGNAYVADSSNHIIRKITSGGVVTTFAGVAGQPGSADGIGSAARFNFPVDVAVDTSGNVYVSDNVNNTIRKITPAGAVSTLAGMAGQMGSTDGMGAAARFNSPWGLTVDGSGNVFVADSNNNTIRKITAAGVVSTVAGVAGPGGYQDGMSGSALFAAPWDVAVDGSGNLFVADSGNSVIREITAAGAVTTFAGNASTAGTNGAAGNADGLGANARFEAPVSIAFDGSGNLVVADGSSNLIRRITPAGLVSTVAGTLDQNGSGDGLAASAVFFAPWGVAVDGSGNIWVADSGNNTVRLISGGSVSTVAGSPGVIGSADGAGSAARFFNPRSTAVDYSGNLYVADTYNDTIRKISPAGVSSTFAGTAGVVGSNDGTGAAAQFNLPWGVAVDATGNVYVADFGNHAVRKITPAGVVTTLAGSASQPGHQDGTGSSAHFRRPRDLAVDGASNVYVTDNVDETIRKITPAGVVTTLAGTVGVAGSADGTGSAASFNNPRGIAVDLAGNVYVTDAGNNTIRQITPAGVVSTLAGMAGQLGTADGTGSAARFNNPSSIVVDGTGNLFVTDSTNETIRRITPAGVVTTVAGYPGVYSSGDGIGSAARFSGPTGISLDGAGNLYLADTGNNTIRKGTPVIVAPVTILSQSPSATVVAGQNTSFSVGISGTGATFQWQASTDGGNTWFNLSYGNGLSGTNSPTLVIAGASLTQNGAKLQVVVTNAAGSVTSSPVTLTVTSVPPGDVVAYNFTTVAGMPAQTADGTGAAAGFNNDNGVTVDSNGNAYVADSSSHTIRKITPAGVVTTFAGLAEHPGSADGTGSAARFNFPIAVAVDASNNVYVADEGNNTIRKISPAGVVTTPAGTAGQAGSANGTGGAAQFNQPYGVAVDSNGNVYVADAGNNTIREISPSGVVTTLAGTAGQIGYLDATGAAAQFNTPASVAVDASNNVYVADSGNNTIRMITPGGGVTTLAGNANQPGTADGTGTAAQFSGPLGVAVDANGNVYVADGDSAIRKIAPGGIVTTLAGAAGQIGSTDGSGGMARFFNPWGMAVFGGNIYVADSSNNTIREITPGGVVSTLAGTAGQVGSADGTGSTSRFLFPRGVTVDVAGNVFVADFANSTIREISPAGAVTTFAGTAGHGGTADGTGAAAQFIAPGNVAVDFAGNLYVTDNGSHAIRKITPAGVVTTFAGVANQGGIADGVGGNARFRKPRGAAVDRAGNLYVADAASNAIRKITPAGVVTTFAGTPNTPGSADGLGTAAQFNVPLGVAVDGNFNVYITDYGNNTIRKITPSGVVTTLAGTPGQVGSADGTGPAARFNQPNGIAVDNAGNVFVTDSGNNTIREITPAGVVTTVAGTPGLFGSADGAGPAAQFYYPFGLAVDKAGNLYVVDNGNSTIRKGTPVTVAPVAITIPPASTSVTAGQNASFSVTVTGDAPFTYQWYLNGQPIGGATASTLSVNNAQSANAGSYTVAVSNGGGTVTSAAGVLTVNAAPSTVTLNNSGSQAFAVDPVDHFLYAAQLGNGSNTLNVINTQTNTVVGSLTYSAGYAASASASGLTVFVPDQGGLVRIFSISSAGTPSAWRTDPASSATGSAALATTYAVTKQGTGDHMDINLISNGATQSSPLIGGSAGNVYSDANTNRYYADYATGTQVVDAATGNIVRGLSGQVVAVDSSSAHNFVYMTTAPGSSVLAQLDGTSNAQTASYTVVGDYVGAVAVDPATGDVFVALPDANQVIHLNDSLAYVGQFSVTAPQAIAVADGELFVQSSGNATLSIFGLSAPARTGQTLTFNALPDVIFSTTPITLTGTSDSGLTVSYTVTNGPATVSGNQLTLTGTGSVTVQASQPGNGSYAPAVSVSRTFNVLPSYASWQQTMFNPGDPLSGPNDIYGQDHLTNLVKYVLGLNPKQNATSGLPVVSTSGGNWVFTFTTPTAVTAANDVTVTVEVSTDLQIWTSIGAATKTNSAGGTDTWQATYSITSAPTVFFRLQVEK